MENNKTSLSSVKYNLLSFMFNWNKDYMKKDQVSIQNCFSIDKLIKKRHIEKNDKDKDSKSNYVSKEHDIGQNTCLSEEKRDNLNNSNKTDRRNSKNNISKYENQIKQKDYYKTNYNNSIFSLNSSNKKYNMPLINSTTNILNKNKDNNIKNNNLFNSKTNTFKELFTYFDTENIKKDNKIKLKSIYNKRILRQNILNNNNMDKNLKNFKTIIKKEEIKMNNYYNTLNNNEGKFPFNTINQKEARVKIKQIDSDIVNVNAHRLYWKKKYSNSRENIQLSNENFSEGLLVEKYNQEKQANIINKIIENKNKKFKEKLKKKKMVNKMI